MIWSIIIISLCGLASARNITYVKPEYLNALRAYGQHEEFARLLGVEERFVRSDNTEQRGEGLEFTNVSELGDIMLLDEEDRQALNLDKWGGNRWPNHRIPYAIATNDFDSDQIRVIEDAINHWNDRVYNIPLVKRTDENDYVLLFSGGGCWSYIGKVGGAQGLSLQRNGCVHRGIVLHELMHAAGFTHEQNRSDRDDHVVVLWNNIPQGWHSQYQKVDTENWKNIGPYDHSSILHYGYYAPGTGKPAFLLPEGVSKDRVGGPGTLEFNDVRKLNILYS